MDYESEAQTWAANGEKLGFFVLVNWEYLRKVPLGSCGRRMSHAQPLTKPIQKLNNAGSSGMAT